MAEPDIEAAAKQARRAAQLAMICVIVAVLVLIIDNSIKRHIVAKASEAKAILEEFSVAAGQVMHGREETPPVADPGGGGPGAGGQSGIGVGDSAGGREDVDAPPVAGGGGSGAGRAGGAGGPRGDG